MMFSMLGKQEEKMQYPTAHCKALAQTHTTAPERGTASLPVARQNVHGTAPPLVHLFQFLATVGLASCQLYGTTNMGYRTTNADAGVGIGMKRVDSKI